MSYSGIIYKYTSPSNKIYIGQSINPSSRRQDFNNLNTSYGGIKIDNARKKYGPKSFKYEILSSISAETESDLAEQLDLLEIYYIDKYDSVNQGYNSSYGGKFGAYKKTQEQIEKSRNSLKKYYETHEIHNKKKVLQYSSLGEFIKEWSSATEAEQYYGLSRSCISNACKSKGTSKGYYWRYKNSDNIEQSIEVKVDKRSLPVIQYTLSGEFIQEWKSSKMASEVLGIYVSNIQACCNGKTKTSNGFIWRYSKDVNLNIGSNGKE